MGKTQYALLFKSLKKMGLLMTVTLVAGQSILSVAHAGNYETDLRHFLSALKQSGFPARDLTNFQNPYLGKRKFILPAAKAPWAGNYFSMAHGGIANRWQVNEHPRLDQGFPDQDAVSRMTPEQIDKLSPAEKYDIYMGDYNFSVTRHELLRRGPFREFPPAHWEGFCNGIRCAGYSLNEPQASIDVVNPDGVRIRFQPSDLKALGGASYFYADKYADIGTASRGNELAANQPNAAVFDLALRFYLGVKQKAFVIDTHLGSEIWNESVVGFERQVGEPVVLTPEEQLKFPEGVRKVKVKTELFTLGEIGIEESNGPTKKQVSEGKMHSVTPIEYTLILDKESRAINDDWSTPIGNRGVDFAWFSSGRGMDAHYVDDGHEANRYRSGNKDLKYEVLKKLFNLARPRTCKSLF